MLPLYYCYYYYLANFFPSPFSLVAHVNESWFAAGLHLVGQSYSASEQTIPRHHLTYNTGHHRTCVNSNANLIKKAGKLIISSSCTI